jgi:type VI secretion system protein ImpA
VSRAVGALNRTREAFIENSGYDYVPSFDRLAAFLTQTVELFRAARPDLGASAETDETIETISSGEEGGEPGTGTAVSKPKASSITGLITSQADAAGALLAIETYFSDHEPSAPALLLVHQARTLVGKPLVHALEILLPDDAPRVMIKIQADLNLQLNMTQLKQLADDVKPLDGSNGTAEGSNAFTAGSRAEAMTLMAEVEHFFKNAEPSSPVPMLLAKASGFSSRDFGSILKDLISPPVE